MMPQCHICNSPSSYLLTKDGYDLYRCPVCYGVFVFPLPAPDFLKKEVYSFESGYQSNRVGDISHNPESTRARLVLEYLEKVQPQGRLLDVGCAHGEFLWWSKKRGFEAVGIELNKRTADSAAAQGFEVFNGFIEDAPFTPHSFDIIYLGEVIEHVHDPRGFLKVCSDFLRPEGMIAITTPNLDCFWSRATFLLWRLFKIPWSSVTPPYHLTQFSSGNLDRLLLREGFSLRKEWFLRIPPLRYELGMMHLLKRYKKTRRPTDFVFMIFGYSLYVPLYGIARLLHPFLKKDFSMIKIYKNVGTQ